MILSMPDRDRPIRYSPCLQIGLTTTGRKSSRPHQVTLYAWPDDHHLVVVGSYAGRDHDPDWVSNLRSKPEVMVRRGGNEVEHSAREVEGPERDRLWALVTREFPLYETYQLKTKRVIPLFILEPTA